MMKKMRVLILGILMLSLLSSCYTPAYPGYLLEGMEEERLKAKAVYVMERFAEGDFVSLEGDVMSKKRLSKLEKDYNELLETIGAHSKCNVVQLGVAQVLFGDNCAYVYVHCNHEYGEIDWVLYFSTDYELVRIEMTLDETSIKDPWLQKT